MRTGRFLYIVVGSILCCTNSSAQEIRDEERLNCDYDACSCVFVELGGNGIGLSLNYERLISRRFGVRGGFGVVPFLGTAVPFHFSWFNGLERKFELGAGLTYLPSSGFDGERWFAKSNSILLSATIGGRFQPRFGGFMIRYAFTPLYSVATNRFLLFGGISFGHAF
jgi:hypothetical protein